MDLHEVRRIVAYRHRRYRNWLRILKTLCFFALVVFLAPFAAFPNRDVNFVETGIYSAFGIIACVVGYCVIAPSIKADIAITDWQLSDINANEWLANWSRSNAEQGAFIGCCGLVFTGQYVPWQGAWDYSLSLVDFHDSSRRLSFTFVRESKAGVKREKHVAVGVPSEAVADARDLMSRLNAAVASPELIHQSLRASNPDVKT